MKYIYIFVCLAASFFYSCSTNREYDYNSFSKDKKIEARVDSVLKLMTLDEKIGQLNQISGGGEITGPSMQIQIIPLIKKGKVGSMFNEMGVEKLSYLQHIAVDSTRLKIPILFAADVIHGYKTIFPINLASSCSWNLDLIKESARIAAKEASSEGISWTFAPMVDITRDPRWGRVMEGAGEDSYLGARIAQAYVYGYQGEKGWKGLRDSTTILACTKHFAAYGAVESGRDYNTVTLSELELRNNYFLPYKTTIESGVATIMTSFNDVLGVPASANKWLCHDILRDEWNFKGLTVTDYTAIMELLNHGVASDTLEAAKLAIDAGIDMDMTSYFFLKSLKSLVKKGKVSEKRINQAVHRVLELKFLLGLFDDPYRYLNLEREKNGILKPEYLKVARLLAQQSIVLLKNNNNFFPIDTNEKQTIAVIGPLAKSQKDLNGEWSIKGDRMNVKSIWQGLQDKYIDTDVKFLYAKGCDIEGKNEIELQKALDICKTADKVLFVGGEDYNMSGEAACRTNIKLPGQQERLLSMLKKSGKPIGLIVCNGRPLDLSWEDENMDAIIEAWYLGTETGNSISDIISGDVNPSGHLTMSFPRNVGQIPIYYNHKNTGRPLSEENPTLDYKSTYLDCDNSPLYPFGYGLSYTKFKISNMHISSDTMSLHKNIDITCSVTNVGEKAGVDLVQLYIRDLVGSITRPVKELKGFKRVILGVGETKKIKFTLTNDDLLFYNSNMQYISEPGAYNVWLGHDAEDNANCLRFVLKR